MSRLCPQCQIPLEPFVFNGATLDECMQCGGIWFDDGELKRCQAQGTFAMIELEGEADAHPAVLPVEMNAEGRMCPVCHTRLTGYNYLYSSNVELDECETCFGVWVQDGELRKMADFLDGERSDALDPEFQKAQIRAEASGLVAMLEQQTGEAKIRSSRIVNLWRSLARRPTPFARSVRGR